MKGSNSLTEINERVDLKLCELKKSKKARDGNIEAHRRALVRLRTDQLKAENEVRA